MKGQVRTGLRTVSHEKSQVGTVRVRVDQVMTCEVKLGQYKSGWYRSSHVRAGQVNLDKVKLSQDRSNLKYFGPNIFLDSGILWDPKLCWTRN